MLLLFSIQSQRYGFLFIYEKTGRFDILSDRFTALLNLRESQILEGAGSRGLRKRLAVLDLLEGGLDGLV